MTTSTWEPNNSPSNTSTSEEDLNKSREYLSQLCEPIMSFTADEVLVFCKALTPLQTKALHQLSTSLNHPKKVWFEILSSLTNEQLKQLIFLFTAADFIYPELSIGEKSPAIKIYAAMKKRKEKLTTNELLWIKANSSNKFIPNGSIF